MAVGDVRLAKRVTRLHSTQMPSRLHKLRAMTAAEIASRVRYRAFLALEEARHRRGHFARPDRLRRALRAEVNGADPLSAISALRERAGVRFFPGVAHRAAMQQLFETTYSAERELATSHAAAALRHEIAFFGERFHYGDKIDWHADPPSGRRWPRTYHRDVLVDQGDAGYGDVKYVWELNRHQFLIDLGKAQFLFGDRAAGGEVSRLVRDWMADNPYGTGVSWACALEPAFRAWSWLWAYRFLLQTGALDADDHLAWLAGFHDHGHFLYRHLEYYSSPFNHLIGEAATLVAAMGVLFPEFREAARGGSAAGVYSNRASRVNSTSMEARSNNRRSIITRRSGSTSWRRSSAENGEELSPAVWSAIERGIEFSMRLMQPDGTVPRIGGADDGKPIRLQHLPFWDFRPYYALGAVLSIGLTSSLPLPGLPRMRCGCSALRDSSGSSGCPPNLQARWRMRSVAAATSSCAATGHRAPTTCVSIAASRRRVHAAIMCEARSTAMPTACR